jgi:hypothetical protein
MTGVGQRSNQTELRSPATDQPDKSFALVRKSSFAHKLFIEQRIDEHANGV